MATEDVTVLLQEWSNGNREALDRLMPAVYRELRSLAAAYMRRERVNHTLQSTAVVHEAFLKLVDQREVRWQNRAHFFGIAAQMIRRILVDHARAQRAAKRGGDACTLALDEVLAVAEKRDIDILALDDALSALARMDERQARVVEMRFFCGLSVEESAEALNTSPATVKRDWVAAKAWLFRELDRTGAAAPPES
ncbi:MAG: sigma-70 family RNA polymerase sigma factor [Bryobacteraceae bacterium]